MGKFCVTDGSIDYIGLEALRQIEASESGREIRGILFDGGKCPICSEPWPVLRNGQEIGQITSAIWSPRLKRNVGLAILVDAETHTGKAITVLCSGKHVDGNVSSLPFD